MVDSENVLLLRPRRLNIRHEVQRIIKEVMYSRRLAMVDVKRREDLNSQTFNVNIADDIPIEIKSDSCLLRAIFNLLKNSSQYSSNDGVINMDICPDGDDKSDKQDKMLLKFKIETHLHVNLDAEDVHKSFQSFYNSDHANDNSPTNSSGNSSHSLMCESTDKVSSLSDSLKNFPIKCVCNFCVGMVRGI